MSPSPEGPGAALPKCLNPEKVQAPGSVLFGAPHGPAGARVGVRRRNQVGFGVCRRVSSGIGGHRDFPAPLTVNAGALPDDWMEEQYGVVERPIEEDAMNDNEGLRSDGKERRVAGRTPSLGSVLAGLAVIAWALISALAAEA